MTPAHGERLADALLEERLIHAHALRSQEPHVDIGFRIVKAHSEQPLPVVLHLHDTAIGGGRREPEDGAVINPGMAGDHAVGFAGFEQGSRQ